MTTPASTSRMVATKKKVLSCSTPEHRNESPSGDSDSLCDSEAASPVPFLCTQDGAEGETDVVWNFYTPNSKYAAKSRLKNTTPLSRRSRKACNIKLIEKPITRRRVVKPSQKNTELYQDLLELNQNLQELIAKKAKTNNVTTEKQISGSEDDIFNVSGESSPKSGLKTNTRCLRKNLLSSKFTKTENDNALESDDSMNEYLLKASQVVEEKILNHNPTPVKRPRLENSNKTLKGVNHSLQFNIDQDSMDAILNSIKLDTPVVRDVRNIASSLNNDTFDNFVGNLNDSALDRLTQVATKTNAANKRKMNSSKSDADWTIQEVVLHESSPMSKSFGRHNSMPESPRVTDIVNKPSTSGMVFGRYNSMPLNKNKNLGDSPIRCTPDEIRRKHQQAREKLLAKRLLPFTQTSQSLPSSLVAQTEATTTVVKKTQFQPRKATSTVSGIQNTVSVNLTKNEVMENNAVDLKLLIEKKRQEALMKLRKRQQPNKKP